jgi:hypothetical protein
MVTGPGEQAYPVMVIPPLLVVKVNWAGATAGNVNSSSSDSSFLQDVSLLRGLCGPCGSSNLNDVFMAHSESREKASSAVLHVPNRVNPTSPCHA